MYNAIDSWNTKLIQEKLNKLKEIETKLMKIGYYRNIYGEWKKGDK